MRGHTIVFWDANGKHYYCFSQGQVKSSRKIFDFYTELSDLKTWYLLDEVSDPGKYKATTVVVASPRRSNYKKFARKSTLRCNNPQ